MLWLQEALFFLLLVSYGVFQTRRSKALLRSIVKLRRETRLAAGPGLIVLGLLFLWAAMVLAQRLGGIQDHALAPAAWFILAVGGLAFVHCQTLGMAVLVSLTHGLTHGAVTLEPPQTSTMTERDGNSVDEKPPD